MDFYKIHVREIERGPNKGHMEVYPDFRVGRSTDLMVRAKSFYAVWDEEKGLWSRDEYDVQRLVDADLDRHVAYLEQTNGGIYHAKHMVSFSNGIWAQFRKFMQNVSDNSHDLDNSLTFANSEVKKTDFVSKRLPYSLSPGDISAWDELVGTLYAVDERAKIEWLIGSIVSGDSKKIQKFGVFYGPGGTGKSTILNIIEKLFEGYTTTFEAKALGSSNNAFATEVFKGNPLVAIQQDGDLSRIEDNTKLNSIISHEDMTMNEKHKPAYTSRVHALLLMGTNQPVKISDAKSGIIRRLIDIHPTGVRIEENHYNTLMSRIDFELGAIAHHCLEVYRRMGRNYYSSYRPLEMMLQTDVFFNYIEANFDIFKEQDSTTLKQAYSLYKEFCEDTGVDRIIPQYKFREELRNYFDEFKDRAVVDGTTVRSLYTGFNANKFKAPLKDKPAYSLVMEETESIFDQMYAGQLAQYANENGYPQKKWEKVTTSLSDLDTTQLHFTLVPTQHIVIDFDLTNADGEKSLDRNLEAASSWPPTYAELSKSGSGVHLHYIYEGDVTELANNYSDGIEVKTLLGHASLRRRLTKCNNIPIATISSGLPVKEKKVLQADTIKSEKGLRDLIARNLRKEVLPGTYSSVDFIKKILDEAYESDLTYDVSDMRSTIIAFANNSSNQSVRALKLTQEMKWKSDDKPETETTYISPEGNVTVKEPKDTRIAFFDVEVYPNLFVVCWKFQGSEQVVRMVNPTAQEVESLFALRLVGFNNRRYDNHILYAAFMGYNNEQLYKLSKKIIDGDSSALFGEAYNLSYADIYDFSSKKQGLKKFMIELGVNKQEMEIPWDEPVPDDMIENVVEYCVNDVEGTEATFESRYQDFVARQVLADLSGLTVNDTTQKHTARIIFGNDRRPQDKFVYTDLSKEFPGYEFDASKREGKSSYRGEDPSEGGYVYAEPGMYDNVAVLDVASMHPTSIEQLNLFGEYTPNFSALKAARIAIKHKDYASARKMLNGKLAPYLKNEEDAEKLSYALKIVINIVYGLTSAKFDNPFKDIRNVDNIVAKRGALFMIDLKNALQEEGIQVVHIKTDSVKIPNCTPEIIEMVKRFGREYGYDFEHEETYDKFCLVNDAVYIAKKADGRWDAVGAQFQHPYVFKTLFSGEPIEFKDLCETRSVVQGAMYLDFEFDTPMVTAKEGLKFVGRVGSFVPVKEGQNGGMLYRVKDDRHYAVTGTKGYLWLEAKMAEEIGESLEIDMSYFESLAAEAVKTIEKFGPFHELVG